MLHLLFRFGELCIGEPRIQFFQCGAEIAFQQNLVVVGASERAVCAEFFFVVRKDNTPYQLLLKQIAEATGGRYFRATDNTKLAEIYSEINRMEKTRTTIDSFPVYKDLFPRYAVIALVCLLLEMLLAVLLRRMP